MDGSVALGSVSLVNGQASLNTSALLAGQHSLTVVYTAADAGFSGSTSTAYTLTVVPPAPGLQVTVTDSSGNPVAGATVTTGDGPQATTDSNGQALLSGLADGSYSVEAALQTSGGYELGQTNGTVSGGAGKVTVVIQPNQVVSASLTANQMTPAQISAAGIDTTDPNNSIVYQFVIHLAGIGDLCGFTNAVSLVTASAGAYSCPNAIGPGSSYSSGGNSYSFGVGGWGGGGGGAGGPAPSLEMLQTPGVSVLKTFFHVDMTIFDLAPSGFSLGSGEASLNVPTGMSLVNGESATQPVADIPGGGSGSVDWIIRGDTPGDYSLSANYGGLLNPLGWPVSVSATTAKPIHVYGPEALKMIVQADSTLYAHLPYRVEICLQNIVTVPMYDVQVLLAPTTSASSYIFQPLQTLGYNTAEIDPSQTWCTGTYELLSPNTNPLDLSQSFVEQMSGAQSMQSTIQSQTPLFTAQTAPTLTASTNGTGVQLAWSAIQGATSYDVFSTPTDTTAFGITPLTTVSGATTSADVPDAGTGAWYVVSALINGVWTMEAPMVQVSGGGSGGGCVGGSPTLVASPTSQYLGQTITLSACGFPANSLIRFGVSSGPDVKYFSAFQQADSSGTASTTMAGKNGAGTDTVIAWLDKNNNGVVDPGELAAPAVKVIWLPTVYVALGDSYSSGEGNPPFLAGTDTTSDQCHRSALGYPMGTANDLGFYGSDFSFHACSGAVISDYYNHNDGTHNEPAQNSWLSTSDALVTITLGGNDLNFAGVIEYCITHGFEGKLHIGTPCEKYQGKRVDAALKKITTPGKNGRSQLQGLYYDIHQRAPYAKILVVGYPQFFASSPFGTCHDITVGDQLWINSMADKFDNAIRAAATSQGAYYVDVENLLQPNPDNGYTDHEECSVDPWINGVYTTSNSVYSFHPNANGHFAEKKRVEAVYDSLP